MLKERISFPVQRRVLLATFLALSSVVAPAPSRSQTLARADLTPGIPGAPNTTPPEHVSRGADTAQRPSPSTTMLESTAGAAVGGFLGIIAAIRPGCGSFVRTGHCYVPTMAIGFGVGTLVGTVAGAIHSTNTGVCGWPERLVRSLAGTLVGFGASVPIVAATHGYVRIGVAPIVPLAGAAGATIVLRQCAGF